MDLQNHDRDLSALAVDCIIFGFYKKKLNVLLVKRSFEPFEGSWSLIGGFVDKKESLEDAANRILNRLTGLEDIYLEQVHTYGNPDRDAIGRVVSVSYYAIIRRDISEEENLNDHHAQWFEIDSLPELIFDHSEMLNRARYQLKIQSILKPIGFKLLPRQFTIPDLQALYEAIFDQEIDPRNFRRRLLSLNILKETGIKDKSSSRKGAFLYEFDKETYDRLVDETTNLSKTFKLF